MLFNFLFSSSTIIIKLCMALVNLFTVIIDFVLRMTVFPTVHLLQSRDKKHKYFAQGSTNDAQSRTRALISSNMTHKTIGESDLEFFTRNSKHILTTEGVSNESIQKHFFRDIENGLSPAGALLNSFVFDLAFQQKLISHDPVKILLLHSETLSHLIEFFKDKPWSESWLSNNQVSANHFKSTIGLIYYLTKMDSEQKAIQKDIFSSLKKGTFNADSILKRAYELRTLKNDVKIINSALFFLGKNESWVPRTVKKKSKERLSFCNDCILYITSEIVSKSSRKNWRSSSGKFSKPESFLLLVVCSYISRILACEFMLAMASTMAAYYHIGVDCESKEMAINLAFRMSENMPEFEKEFGEYIASFITNPSDETFKQALVAYNNIPEEW